jgi:integrase/recombinase XerD
MHAPERLAYMTTNRTPPKKKAKELAKFLRTERPDYLYLKSVFRELRTELEIAVPRKEVRLPEVPTEDEIRRFYQAAWNCRNFADMVLIKTLFYTGVRVSELVAIRLDEVDVERCQIRITQGKGSKDRQVPFPHSFRELLALHVQQMRDKGATSLPEAVLFSFSRQRPAPLDKRRMDSLGCSSISSRKPSHNRRWSSTIIT